MKVAVLGESSVDEAAVRIFVNAILGDDTTDPGPLPLRSRGWPSVRNQVIIAWRHLFYRTEAEALAVVIDSNRSPIHDESHSRDDADNSDCRLCWILSKLKQTAENVKPVPNRRPVKVAIGLAVPAIEAWLLCGVQGPPNVSEATWISGLQSGSPPYDKLKLKREVYGTDRASLPMMKEVAVREATRLASNITQLENWFPGGFGAFAKQVRSWKD